MKNINNMNFKGKKVLVRADLNVPHKNGKITDINRIVQSIPTIKTIIAGGAEKVIICSHLGRVKSDEDKKKNNMDIVAMEMSKQLGESIHFVNATRGADLEKAIKENKIVMFQNTRYEDFVDGKETKFESKCDEELSKYWAGLCDVFVSDAFGTAHRAHASNVGITNHAKEACPGLLLDKEIKALSKALNDAEKPYVAVLGGAKVSDKIEVINSMLEKADKLIIGGAMAYTFNMAKGIKTGNSLVEKDKVELAKELLAKAGDKIVLPIDHKIATAFDAKEAKDSDNDIEDGFMGLDIGPKSIELFKKTISDAKTIIWNGPMGVFENPLYEKGTKELAIAISNIEDAFTVIGGGDSAAAAIQFKIEDKFSHVSTGGGASLEFLEGKTLPAVDALAKK